MENTDDAIELKFIKYSTGHALRDIQQLVSQRNDMLYFLLWIREHADDQLREQIDEFYREIVDRCMEFDFKFGRTYDFGEVSIIQQDFTKN